MRGGASAFRLHGKVGRARRVFLVHEGGARVGSRPGHGLVLPVRGVSRDHAELRVTAEGLRVRDLGSKNGLRLNGRRVDEAMAVAGDRLHFGPVELEVEEVEPGDAVLAVSLDGEPPTPAPGTALPSHPGSPSHSGTWGSSTPWLGSLASVDSMDTWWAALEEVAAGLSSEPPSLPAVTAAVGRTLGARGACFALLEGRREPVVLSAWGRLDGALEAESPIFRRLADRGCPAPGETRQEGAGLDGEPRVLRLGTAGGCLLLALWEPAVVGSAATSFLSLVLRLVATATGEVVPRAGEFGASGGPGEFGDAGDSADAGAAGAGGGELVFPPGYVAGASAAVAVLHRQMRGVAASGLPVLVRGETGVGKEMVARTLHLSSPRSAGPLVAVNCAAIPADLLEAEMFGIGKGVATGVEARQGRFQEADGGTLFLDEVGEMPPPLQAKLLRALEEGVVQPLGRRPQAIDVRLVAATNADLLAMAKDGRFREDLYYRLAGAVLDVPPLRRRPEDVTVLLEHFGRRAARAAGKTVHGVTWRALERLTAHPWLGNVRELAHLAERLVHLAPDGGAIDSTLLPPEIGATEPGAAAGVPVAEVDSLRLEDHVEPLERRLVEEALHRTGGNRTRAAELLGMSRNGLAYKLKNLGLDG